MKIVTLIENESFNKDLKTAHGLSLYIEHNEKKILFDVGPNNDFVSNAELLGIDLAEVDTVIISHGHYDHGRGLKKFMEINSKAKIYASKNVFNKQFKKKWFMYIPIGLKKPQNLDRITFLDKKTKIVDGIVIYTKVKYMEQIISDSSLLAKRNGKYVTDRFDHEIYLSLFNEEVNVLISGCSHKGIENIIDVLEAREKISFTHIIGGFHMSHYDPQDLIQTTYLESLGQKFFKKKTKTYYSCHCTGDDAYSALKPQMKHKLERIKTGSILNL